MFSPTMLTLIDFIAVAAAAAPRARTDYILSYDWKFASESFPKPKNLSLIHISEPTRPY